MEELHNRNPVGEVVVRDEFVLLVDGVDEGFQLGKGNVVGALGSQEADGGGLKRAIGDVEKVSPRVPEVDLGGG
jgi:hypothetical protein